ncbi:MAG: pyruvate dehydrogenase (acetyl-transferring) E1 component subunit alpha [Actinobacteria bacterium]|nr:MAG: pyruvate dehydrogenase (acetyl-transferring) E1 component subunit alpha [Actinomycetota bacterium]
MRRPEDLDWEVLHEIVDRNGRLVGDAPWLTEELALDLYRDMVRTRIFDRRATAAQRQGRLGTYAIAEGHEAIQVGSAHALRERDFIYPGYREHGVHIARGMPLETVLAYWRGLPNTTWDPPAMQQMVITVPIGSHLPHAVGHAYAERLKGNDVVTVTYVGDGGTSENDFHSGLNFAGVWRTPTVFIVSNNFYAISVPYERQTAAKWLADKAPGYGMAAEKVNGFDAVAVYDATRRAVERGSAGEGPTLIEAICYRFGPHATADDPALYRTREEEELWRPLDPVDRMRAFVVNAGWWDDAAEEQLATEATEMFDEALEAVLATELPPRVDIITQSFDKVPSSMIEQLHRLEDDAGEERSNIPISSQWIVGEDNLPPGPTTEMTMADAINAALHQEMAADPTTVLLGEDVALAGGVFRVTAGLLDEFGSERVIDTPINESGIVGTAIGMAMAGIRPIAEIQFEGFSYPAFDQIASHLGRIRFRTRGNTSLPMVVRMPNGAGIRAHEHHCDSPEAYFAHVPGIVVVVPSSPTDAKGLLAAAIRSDDPVMFLEPKVLYRAGREAVPDAAYELPLGRARVRRAGGDITLITYGGMVPVSLRAAAAVAKDGVDVEVIDLRTVYPWDVETVSESVIKTNKMLFVQEPQRSGGIGAEVVAEIAERCGYDLVAPPRRLAATDAPWPQFAMEHHALITDVMVATELRSLAEG